MTETLALVALVGLLAGLIVRLRRRTDKPVRSIASLTPGWAEVRGHARGGGSKLAPISGRCGLGWRVLVEQESVMGWVTVVEHSECGDFELEDPSGSIRVRASDSPIMLEVAVHRGRGGPFSPPPPHVQRLIAGTTDPRGVLFHKGFRWREWVLEEGQEIVVRGRVISEPGDVSVGYRQIDEALVLAGGTARPLQILD